MRVILVLLLVGYAAAALTATKHSKHSSGHHTVHTAPKKCRDRCTGKGHACMGKTCSYLIHNMKFSCANYFAKGKHWAGYCDMTCKQCTAGQTGQKNPQTQQCQQCVKQCSRYCSKAPVNVLKSTSKKSSYTSFYQMMCSKCTDSCIGVCRKTSFDGCSKCMHTCKTGDSLCLEKCHSTYCSGNRNTGSTSARCKECTKECKTPGDDCNSACARVCDSNVGKYWPGSKIVPSNDRCMWCHQACLDDSNPNDFECHSKCDKRSCGSGSRQYCHQATADSCSDKDQQKGTCMKAHLTCEEKYYQNRAHHTQTSTTTKTCIRQHRQCQLKCYQSTHGQLQPRQLKSIKSKYGSKKPSGHGRPTYTGNYNNFYRTTRGYPHYSRTTRSRYTNDWWHKMIQAEKECRSKCDSKYNCQKTQHSDGCLHCHAKCKDSDTRCHSKCSAQSSCHLKSKMEGFGRCPGTSMRCACCQVRCDYECDVRHHGGKSSSDKAACNRCRTNSCKYTCNTGTINTKRTTPSWMHNWNRYQPKVMPNRVVYN